MRKPLLFLLSCFLILTSNTSAQQDDEFILTSEPNCCYMFAIINLNSSNIVLDHIRIQVISPGDTVYKNATAPIDWTVSYIGNTIIDYTTQTNLIGAGVFLDGFRFCLPLFTHPVRVRWATMKGSVVVSTGEIQLVCCDAAVPRKIGNDCCFDWKIFNNNIQQRAIDQIQLQILDPAVAWGTTVQAPPQWTVTVINPQLLEFSTSSNPIVYGSSLEEFLTCFDVSGPRPFRVAWRTIDRTLPGILCSDSLMLVCLPPVRYDSLSFDESPPNSCCLDIGLHNRNSQNVSLNELRMTVLTPGANIIGTPSGPWPVKVRTGTSVSFASASGALDPGQSLKTFRVCVEHQPGVSGPILIRWESFLNSLRVTEDTITTFCSTPVRCDEIRSLPLDVKSDTCCYMTELVNRHTPVGELTGVSFSILNLGVTFAGFSSGPWPIVSQTGTEVVFETPSIRLAAGDTLRGFRFCFKAPGPTGGTVLVRWQTELNKQPVCVDTLPLLCEPVASEERCDSIFLRSTGACSFDAGFVNKRIPQSGIDEFTIRLLTPSRSFRDVLAPFGWGIQTQTAQRIVFRSQSGTVPSGSAKDGFLFSIAGGPGTFSIEGCTALLGNVLCCDTLAALCEIPPTQCDSLITNIVSDSCEYRFGFINKHTPVSLINGFRVTVLHPGVIIDRAAAPLGWIIESRNANSISFKDTSGRVQPNESVDGFLLRFKGSSSRFDIQWCTLLNDSLLCCAETQIECDLLQTRCDSLLIVPGMEGCSFDLGFANMHLPSSPINAFRISLQTLNAEITSIETPPGWKTALETATTVLMVDTMGSISAGERISGFILRLSPPFNGSEIQFRWCTLLGDSVICCDDTRVECQESFTKCDSIAIVADSNRACCHDFDVSNIHEPQSEIISYQLNVITPGVTLMTSKVESPVDWIPVSTSSLVSWTAIGNPLTPFTSLKGFMVCFDNSAINHQDFHVLWRTLDSTGVVCSDTIRISCDRTLGRTNSVFKPATPVLGQNYPNPFGGWTMIPFALPQREHIRLVIYNTLGQAMLVLMDSAVNAGEYSIPVDMSSLPQGTYVVRLHTPQTVLSRTIQLTR